MAGEEEGEKQAREREGRGREASDRCADDNACGEPPCLRQRVPHGIFVSGENYGGGGTGIQKLLPIAIFVAASVKFVAESAVKWTRGERAGGDGNVPARENDVSAISRKFAGITRVFLSPPPLPSPPPPLSHLRLPPPPRTTFLSPVILRSCFFLFSFVFFFSSILCFSYPSARARASTREATDGQFRARYSRARA